MQQTQDDLKAGSTRAVATDLAGSAPAAQAAADAPSDDSAQELDEDQQRAFESIMAQIESDPDSHAADDSDADIAFDTITDDAAPDTEDTDTAGADDGGDGGDADAETHDISADIEDLLQEIASGDGAAGPDAADAQADQAGQPPDPEPAPAAAADDRPAAAATMDHPAVSGQGPEGLPSEPPPVAPAPVAARKPAAAARPSPHLTPPCFGAAKTARRAAAVLAAALLLAGSWYWVYSDRAPVPAESDTAAPPALRQRSAEPAAPGVPDPVSGAASTLAAAAERLDRLRQQLIEKSTAIEQLCSYYRAGIDAETDRAIQLLQDAGRSTGAHVDASENPRLQLALTAIQRRTATIDKLDAPQKALQRGSEELLYLSRRADLLALMADKTSDIDIDGFVQLADERMADHREMLARLNIDAADTAEVTLTSIWQEIEKRMAAADTAPGAPVGPPPEKGDDAAIWKEICAGDFSRKHLLTRLPPQVAQCLSTWTGKDLFLNGLTELSPASARLLAAWGGDWLGLNALADLSPEAARHLSRWRGKGLSLNGLLRLSPQVAAILSQWQGEQIELVNLTHAVQWDNPRTRLYLSENMTRDIHATRK